MFVIVTMHVICPCTECSAPLNDNSYYSIRLYLVAQDELKVKRQK